MVARLIGGEGAFADRRHCSVISCEEQIAAREGGAIIIIMMTSRLSRCHQTTGLVAANEALFKRARCVSVMVRAQNFIRRFAKGVCRFALLRKCA
jgi:hypothetical protein